MNKKFEMFAKYIIYTIITCGNTKQFVNYNKNVIHEIMTVKKHYTKQ
jgi:hypothetical protein